MRAQRGAWEAQRGRVRVVRRRKQTQKLSERVSASNKDGNVSSGAGGVRAVEAEAAAPPPAMPAKKEGWPGYVWLLIGMGLAGAGMKVVDAVQSRQQSMQQKMMEQMLKTASAQQSQQASAAFNPMSNPSSSAGPVVDTQKAASSSPVSSSAAAATTPSSSDAASTPSSASPSASGTTIHAGESSGSASATSSTTSTSGDDAVAAAATAGADGGSNTGSAGPSFFKDPEVVESNNGASASTSSDSASGGTNEAAAGSTSGGTSQGKFTLEMLERMLDDPNMAETVKPHLPEGMKDPETFKSLMQNPMYRQQLEQMLDNMGEQAMPGMGGGDGADSAAAAAAAPGMNMSSDEVKQQFDQLGVSPEELMQKVMADPELQQAFQQPRIQNALMECSQNPMNIAKYNDDEEVMRVFTKISSMMPQK